MRVVLIGQRGPYSPYAFRHLVRHLEGCDLVALVEGRRKPAGGREHRWLKPRANAPIHKHLPKGESLVDLGVAARIPILQTMDINAPVAIDAIRGTRPDLLVCVGFSKLFSTALLEVAPRGAINAHPSALPKWRGPAPIFWQLKEGMAHLPVTVHRLDALEDHGPILGNGTAQVFPRMAGDDIYAAAGECAGRLLKPLLEQMSRSSVPEETQQGEPGPRARRPREQDAIIDNAGDWPAERLVNFACGAPWFANCSILLGDDVFEVGTGIRTFMGQTMPAHYMVVGEELTIQCVDGLAVVKIAS